VPLPPNKQKIEQFGKPTSDTIPTIIRLFKSACTIQINAFRNTPRVPVWQRGYYEHVIRDEKESEKTREYIVNNPLKWELDRFNPDRILQPNKR
jgi:putative transposase